MTATTDSVQRLYIAYFGRPADPVGLAYWQSQIDVNKQSLESVANNFALSPEYSSTFVGLNASQSVTAIYQNLFGRAPDAAGLLYWAGQLTAGSQSIGKIALSIATAARDDATAGTFDLTTLNSKIQASANFTAQIDTAAEINGYSGADANALARAYVAGVVDAATLQSATANVATTVANVVAVGGPAGQTLNLTQNADNVTGTANNDTFNAKLAVVFDNAGRAVTVNTLQDADSLVGGAGTDTLNAVIGVTSLNPIAPTLSGIEVVNATFNVATTLSLANATGVSTVGLANGSAAGTVTNVGGARLSVSNQSVGGNFDGLTAATTVLSVTSVGKSGSLATIDLGVATANQATAETLNLSNAYIDLNDFVAASITSATINAIGKNSVKFTDAAGTLTSLTVTGTGSVNTSSVALTTLKTLTVGDGGITLDATGGTALKTITTGAGTDVITTGGVAIGTVNLGSGNDSLTLTTAASATGVVNLGDGNDTLTLNVAPTAGATLTGGNGTDTLAVAVADYNTISGFSSTNLAKITGFEVLSITGAPLANASTVNLASLAGLTSLTTLGVAKGGTATVTGVGANATVAVTGATATNNGTLTVTLADATGTSDVLNLVVNTDATDNGNGAANSTASGTGNFTASGVETINLNSTFTLTNAGAADDLDFATNTVSITDTALKALNISGAAVTSYTAASGNTALASIDASASTGAVTINAASITNGVAVNIKGSATAVDTLTGSVLSDTIVGGSKADFITGGTGGDTLTGGAGNDTFIYTAANQSTIASGNSDTITDFVANTYGNGTSGAAGTGATATLSSRTGDVLQITHLTTNNLGVTVGVYTNAADVQTFLQTQSATEGGAATQTVHAGLNSTTGDLYIDVDGNGTADLYIHLTGVTTINAAAFVIV